eukprot:5988285-Alexandrium_andersonii.AAC.1
MVLACGVQPCTLAASCRRNPAQCCHTVPLHHPLRAFHGSAQANPASRHRRRVDFAGGLGRANRCR